MFAARRSKRCDKLHEMMVRHDCGEIAIVENVENLKPIGLITDRDIAWRVVAAGKIPAQTNVRDAMLSDL